MATTLAAAPYADGTDLGSEPDAMPTLNPITVSMALAVGFLVVLLAVVAIRPTDAHELRGADEVRAAAAAAGRGADPDAP